MKFKLQIAALAVIVAACAALFSAFAAPERMGRTVEMIDENGNTTFLAAGAAKTLAKTYTLDTLTNAANDTLSVPWILESPYQYCYQFKVTNISGTTSIKVYLEQRNYTASTEWTKVDSVSLAADPGSGIMKGANTWGLGHRLIVDGAGTQSTSYRASALLKPTK